VVSDRLTAEVNLAAMESARVQAASRLERARTQLKLAMGLAPAAEVVVTPYPGATAPERPQPAALAELEAQALAGRHDLAAARALTQAARTRVEAARAAHRPQVDLIASHARYDNGDADAGSSSVMGVLSLDLWSGGRPSAEIAAAVADARQAEWDERAYEQAVRQDVREAHEALREARARHALARGNVERARDNVRQIKTRYGQGRTILIDLLQAERALVEARNEELIARLNLETSGAALELAQGKLAVPGEATP
jgi:outer membrane protein TolC